MSIKTIKWIYSIFLFRKKYFRPFFFESIALLKAIINGTYTKYAYSNFILIFLCIGYLFSILDFIPDFIPFAGWVDDGLVLYFGFKLLKREITRYQSWRKEQLLML